MKHKQVLQTNRCRISTLVSFSLLISGLIFLAEVVTAPQAKASVSECVKANEQRSAGYLTFEIRYSDNQSGCNWTVPSYTYSSQVVLVGGGGGAGLGWAGGGGGGGQVQFNSSLAVIPGQIFNVVVGQGGAKKTTTNRQGNNGEQTTFGEVTALGGGGGGGSNSYWYTAANISAGMSAKGSDGGSGGGNNVFGTASNNLSGGLAIANEFTGWQAYGNPGGTAIGNGSAGGNATWGAGSGGGGAYEPGTNSTNVNGAVTLGRAGRGIWLLDHCLGGGGESNYQGTPPAGFSYGSSLTTQQACVSPDGSTSGGTSGALYKVPATPNTGGGGGGYSISTYDDYYAGANGVVVIRYADPAQPVVDLVSSSDLGISNSDNLTNDLTPTIGISNLVSGATALVTATKNSETKTCSISSGTSCDLPTLSQGIWTVTATQTYSGQTSIISNGLGVTIDTTAPSAPTITSAPTSGTSTSATVAFTGEVGATFECKVDSGTYASCTSPKTFTGLADGAHTIYIKQTDAFGNVGSARTSNWTIDTTAPAAAITSAAQSTSATPTISGTAESGSDVTLTIGGATYIVTATGGTWTVNLATATRSSGSLSLNTNGNNNVSVVATDSYGNNSATATQTLLIDTVAPTVLSKNSPSSPTNDLELDFTITFSETITGLSSSDFNLTGTSCSITSISGSTTVYIIQVKNCADGATVNLELKSNRVEDLLSNSGPTTDATFTSVVIDRTAPSVAISSAVTSGFSRPTISGTVENGAQVTVNIGSATYQFTASSTNWSINLATSTTTTGSLSLNTNGSNSWSVTAADTAGNSSTVSQTLTIDTVKPTVAKKDTPRSPSTRLSLTYILRFSETVTGLEADDFFISGGFCQVDSITPDSGSYLVLLKNCVDSKPISLMLQADAVIDSVGNVGPSQNETFSTVWTDTTYVEPVYVAPKSDTPKEIDKATPAITNSRKIENLKQSEKTYQLTVSQLIQVEKFEATEVKATKLLITAEKHQEVISPVVPASVERQFFALMSLEVEVEGSAKVVVYLTKTPLLSPYFII
jgi:hypothetical protein